MELRLQGQWWVQVDDFRFLVRGSQIQFQDDVRFVLERCVTVYVAVQEVGWLKIGVLNIRPKKITNIIWGVLIITTVVQIPTKTTLILKALIVGLRAEGLRVYGRHRVLAPSHPTLLLRSTLPSVLAQNSTKSQTTGERNDFVDLQRRNPSALGRLRHVTKLNHEQKGSTSSSFYLRAFAEALNPSKLNHLKPSTLSPKPLEISQVEIEYFLALMTQLPVGKDLPAGRDRSSCDYFSVYLLLSADT